MSLTDNKCPYDMLKFFGFPDEGDLETIQIGNGDEWVDVEPFTPDATLLVVLYQRGVRTIAVRYEERVVEFKLYDVILRDGPLQGVER